MSERRLLHVLRQSSAADATDNSAPATSLHSTIVSARHIQLSSTASEEQFLERRRKGLARYLTFAANHPVLRKERLIHVFLNERLVSRVASSYAPPRERFEVDMETRSPPPRISLRGARTILISTSTMRAMPCD